MNVFFFKKNPKPSYDVIHEWKKCHRKRLVWSDSCFLKGKTFVYVLDDMQMQRKWNVNDRYPGEGWGAKVYVLLYILMLWSICNKNIFVY